MLRPLVAATCCTLALATLVSAAGSVDSPDQRRPSLASEASALRHQLRVERIRTERSFRAMRRSFLSRSNVSEAIHLSAVLFGVDEGRMRMVIGRESGFRPWAKNPHSTASGLGQFLDSTWAATPCGKAGLSVFSAYANALCMGWTIRYGGGWGHWALTAG